MFDNEKKFMNERLKHLFIVEDAKSRINESMRQRTMGSFFGDVMKLI
jgi:hypothetical protein